MHSLFRASAKPLTRSSAGRVVLLLALSLFVLTAFLRVQTYQRVVAQAEQLTLEHLSGAAFMAASTIDADMHAELTATYLEADAITALGQDERYDQIHHALKHVHDGMELKSPMYTYTLEGPTAVEFVATSSEQPYFRHQFTTTQSEQLRNVHEAGTLPVYRDALGVWLSAFAPIKNAAGEVVAVVQADERFDTFIAGAREAALAGIGWDIAVFLLVTVVVARFTSAAINRERDGKAALTSALERQQALSQQLLAREQELDQQSKLLARSNRDLTDFANIASHDLKSPLRGIASFAQLLGRKYRPQLDERGNEYLDFILSNSKRALRLVDGLLGYAKAEQEVGPSATFCLSDSVHAAQENLYAIIEDRGAVINVEELPELFADEVLVTQLMQNLMGNGLKYNRSACPTVRVFCTTTAEGLTIGVEDNGIGIAAEHQAGVFDMFRRLHGTDEFEGSGIGLAFCVRVVTRYGGRMWLQSEEGCGSTFYFTLPDAAPAAARNSALVA